MRLLGGRTSQERQAIVYMISVAPSTVPPPASLNYLAKHSLGLASDGMAL
jgi:hypothetical protein